MYKHQPRVGKPKLVKENNERPSERDNLLCGSTFRPSVNISFTNNQLVKHFSTTGLYDEIQK